MSKKSPRFINKFVGEYLGITPNDFASNLTALMGRSKEFLEICNGDLDFARNLLQTQDSQETRRIYIRTIPPFIEGSLSFLRVSTYLYPPLLKRIPEDCKVLFAETMLPLRNRATAKETIRQTFLGIGKVAGIEIPEDLMGESGAQALMATFELRDSLMHPRSFEGFQVSDAQLKVAHVGVHWFYVKFVSILSPMIEMVRASSEFEDDKYNYDPV